MANTRQTNTNNFDYKATKENPQAFQCGGVSNAGKFLRVGTNGYVILSDGSGAEPNKYVKDIHKKGTTAIDFTQMTDGVEELISFEPDFTKTTVSATGTATDIVYYITVGDTEYKLPTVSGDYIAKVDGVGTGTTSLENLTIDGDLLGKADSVVDFSLSADVDLGTNAYCSMLATPNLTSVTNVDYVNTHFIKLLPLETYSHEPYHFPFHFSNLVYTPATKKLTGTLHTITLDNNKTITQYPLEVELPIPELADNLTTTTTGKALDANQGNVLANGLALEIQNRTDADQELEDSKQDKLPTPVAGKYLKANDSTGAIEWADGVDTTNFVTTNTAQTITGQKRFDSAILMGDNTGIKKLDNRGNLVLWSSNNNYAGASLYMYGTAGGGDDERGTFNLSSCNGSTKHSLIGSLDGVLTWKGNEVITAAGGTMTGALISDLTVPLRKNDITGYMKIGVGTDSNLGNAPSMRVYGTDHSTYAGSFMCEANSGDGTQRLLLGKPDGTLTWSGYPVLRKRVLGGNLITGITNGTVNTGVSYAIELGGGVYYLALLLSNVTLSRGETKIANELKINGTTITSISALSGNANSSGTFLPATAIVWSGGCWVSHYEAGTGEVRLCGMVIA